LTWSTAGSSKGAENERGPASVTVMRHARGVPPGVTHRVPGRLVGLDGRDAGVRVAATGRLGAVDEPPLQDRRFVAAVAKLRTVLGAEPVDAAVAEGALLSLDQAVGFARRARGSRGRPTSGWASLTPTEREVTALVSEGMSNPTSPPGC
jgi:hypothetical protein